MLAGRTRKGHFTFSNEPSTLLFDDLGSSQPFEEAIFIEDCFFVLHECGALVLRLELVGDDESALDDEKHRVCVLARFVEWRQRVDPFDLAVFCHFGEILLQEFVLVIFDEVEVCHNLPQLFYVVVVALALLLIV